MDMPGPDPDRRKRVHHRTEQHRLLGMIVYIAAALAVMAALCFVVYSQASWSKELDRRRKERADMPEITYMGITHSCQQEDCHLVSFLATLNRPEGSKND